MQGNSLELDHLGAIGECIDGARSERLEEVDDRRLVACHEAALW